MDMKNVKAIYVGVDNKPVKVWDKEQGIIDKERYEAVLKAVREVG